MTSIYLSGASGAIGAIDPTRKLFVLVGNYPWGACGAGEGVFVADISNPASTTKQDWRAATMADPTCAEFLGGRSDPISAFDSVVNDFVG